MRVIPFTVLDLAPINQGSDAAQGFRNSLDLAQHAERWGNKRFWLAEHHNIPGIASAATAVVIDYVAGGTRIGVGSGGVMLPNQAPFGRGAIWHAGIALPGPHRSRPRPRAQQHRSAHTVRVAPGSGDDRREFSPRCHEIAGAAGLPICSTAALLRWQESEQSKS
jgi:hypothetical protein